jgi:uncharacterized damage-inducible protein DinB
METTNQLAERLREVLLRGKWIANTNCRELLENLNFQQATHKIGSLNTIAALTFHMNYYLAGVLNVLEGGKLEIRDHFSFEMPPITSQNAWENLRDDLLANAERFAVAVEHFPAEKLEEPFAEPKYGSYRRNIEGIIEHCYYHMGQIALLKKMILEQEK